MEVRPGYKQTEVAVIPQDWVICQLSSVSKKITDGEHVTPIRANEGYFLLSARNVLNGRIDVTDVDFVGADEFARIKQRCNPEAGDILISCSGTIGRVAVVPRGFECVLVRSAALVKLDHGKVDSFFVQFWLQAEKAQGQISNSVNQGAQPNLFLNHIERLNLPLPALPEQRAIAAVLSDVDALLTKLDQLIAKKRNLKQATMQQLLTGKTRLPGFDAPWNSKRLEDVTDCLDTLRVPLNEAQRDRMRGDYPYCGANGVLDYINDYLLDDDVILIAEDGGYFDEYAYRPIAYRMIGKCWVNNHAHILKAKPGYDQGFLFYSLVHKNILNFLASGTRAKLNKSEMKKIEVSVPSDIDEQTSIAAVLTDMDAELTALEARRDKVLALKQGMMQELLTGRIRLV